MIVAFEVHETEVGATEKVFERRESIVMVVLVEQRQELASVFVCDERVRSRGVDDNNFVVVKTRCHGNESQFIRSPSTGTESHFLRETFGGFLLTMNTSSGIGPSFTTLSILTGQIKTTCRDDGSRTAPASVVSGLLDRAFFHLFESDVRLISGHVLAFSLDFTRW